MPATDRPRFAHLHLHSEYSLLDGGNLITPLIERVKALGMDAVALTDHGNLFGAIEFYTKAREAGVKPILGIEAYVAPADRRERKTTGIADGGFHLVLLAMNIAGWRNLLKLSSDSFLNGFYYKPRMDKSTLEAHADGLIAINGHLGSSLAHHLLQFAQTSNETHWQAALDEARWHAATFGPDEHGQPRFYIELQRHDTPEQERNNPHLVRLARELNLPLVCDNDAHFLLAEDWDVHDTLCCISMGKLKEEQTRLHYPKQLYVKAPEQMAELFAEWPEAVENTVRIADRCNVDLDFSESHTPLVKVEHEYVDKNMPAFPGASAHPNKQGSTEWYMAFCSQFKVEPFDATRERDISIESLQKKCDSALRSLCLAGLEWRYGTDEITGGIRDRLERELTILSEKRISAYFLIVWDFVNWARQRGIPAAARGSGVGTMVGYVLGLSNACPERYGLLFERFTDPDRAEYPDIDVDICQDGRAAVINYVRQKYGHVAQIITFGRLKAKAAIKDVARVMGLTPGEGQRLANLVPNELHITIENALQKEPDFKSEYATNPTSRKVIDVAQQLEDHARHAGVHAAGVVIATQPLDNIVPLCRTPGNEDIVTQWDGPTCEKVGLLKMDFLGLRTLSTIELAKKLIRESLPDEAIWNAAARAGDFSRPEPERGPHPLDLDRLHLDDPKVFELFARGDTAGVFQFESDGMRRLLIDMKPDRLEDLIAANALFRPGPMELIPDYCMRKHRRQPVPRIHEIVDQFTAETYGIMVYQEQVMQIVHGLGGIPLRAAYSLIKAISKKKHSVIDAERPKFIEGAVSRGLSQAQAGELFNLILKFAGYGFNKSHSTGYAIIAYHTAYLKTYFPNQYMAALLTFESAARKVDDWVQYLEQCKRTVFPDHHADAPHVGVKVLPPDINLSDADFAVVFEPGEPRDALHGHVRFGLGAIKSVGAAAIRSIIDDRAANGPFESIFDLCERVDLRAVNKATIESLIKSGAFDSLHGPEGRAAALAAVADAVSAGQRAAADRSAGQMSIFESLGGDTAEAAPKLVRQLPGAEPWDQFTMLENERQTLGFHISGHPLDQFESMLEQLRATPISRAREMSNDAPVRIGAIVTRVRPTVVRNGAAAGQRMAMISMQDKTGSIDGVVFSSAFAQFGQHLRDRAIVTLTGRVDRKRGEPSIIVDEVHPIDLAARKLASCLEIDVPQRGEEDDAIELLNILAGVLGRFGGSSAVGDARPVEVLMHLHTDGRCVTLRPRSLRVTPDGALLRELTELLGSNAVRFKANQPTAPPRQRDGANNGRPRRAESVAV